MSDPWWFRGKRFTDEVDGLDAVGRADVVAAVGQDTRWYRWIGMAAFAWFAIGGLSILVHDLSLRPPGPAAWWHYLSFFVLPFCLLWRIMIERIVLVTHRKVRAHGQCDLRTEIATLLATRPS